MFVGCLGPGKRCSEHIFTYDPWVVVRLQADRGRPAVAQPAASPPMRTVVLAVVPAGVR